MVEPKQLSHRNSSIELLRLILMLFIVIHHGIVHGLCLTALSPNFDSVLIYNPEKYPLIILLNSLCIVGVNCFILISGYYQINFTKKKFLNLIGILIFYTIILNVIPECLSHNYRKGIRGLLFLSHSPYWFVIDYIFLMFFAPLLNMMFEKMNRKYITTLIVIMTIMSIYFGFLWNNKVNDNGYSFFQFIYIYCLGRYLRWFKLSNTLALTIYVICSVLTAFIMLMLIKYGFDDKAWRMTYYNNPLIILASIGLFFVFNNMSFYSKGINYIAKSALAIYLVQSSTSISKIYYDQIATAWKSGELSNNSIIFFICILSIGIVILSLFIDIIRRTILNGISHSEDSKLQKTKNIIKSN